MLATAAPPGFAVPRSQSGVQANVHRVPFRGHGGVHPSSISMLEQQAIMAGGYASLNTRVGTTNEEISTIFVVGFPDDMQEREFQNMFIFSPGFEAATLKIPNYNPDDIDINGSVTNTRKQIIGFAKFRTRLEALEARDVLSGRKVDADKGSVLKAEMAKKNLHTKRGLTHDQHHGHSLTSQAALASRKQQQYHRISSAYDAFYSVPACAAPLPTDLLSPPQDFTFEHTYSAGMDNFSGMAAAGFPGEYHQHGIAAVTFADSGIPGRIGGLVTAQNCLSSDNVEGTEVGQQPHGLHQQQASAPAARLGSAKSLLNLPDLPAGSLSELACGGGGDGKLASRPLSDLSSAQGSSDAQGLHSALFGGIAKPDRAGQADDTGGQGALARASVGAVPGRFTPLSMATAAAAANGFNRSGVFPAAAGMATAGVRAHNSGDQNPPCNTLYVGNLPANASEEELRRLFSNCLGFKQMCFRAKSNGPMCFVEFEDVTSAAHALHELHGNQLSNSVKGGIRLSFSKNPLGVRPHPLPTALTDSSLYVPNGSLAAAPAGHFLNWEGGTAGMAYSAAFHEVGALSFPAADAGAAGYAGSLLCEGMKIDGAGCAADQLSVMIQPPPSRQITVTPAIPSVASSRSSSSNNLIASECASAMVSSSNLASSTVGSSGMSSPNPTTSTPGATNPVNAENNTGTTAANHPGTEASISSPITAEFTGQE